MYWYKKTAVKGAKNTLFFMRSISVIDHFPHFISPSDQ